MKKKLYRCTIAAVVLAVMSVLSAIAANPVTVEFQNGSEMVGLVFSDVLLEGTVSQIAIDTEGLDTTPADGDTYINVYNLAVPVGSTITEVLLPGSHGRYSITVKDSAGEVIDFYSLYSADELETAIIAAALAGNEQDYKYYTALRDSIKNGLNAFLTKQIKYSGPKDKYSGLQRRETVYQLVTIGEFTLWFQPESADGATMAIKLNVTDGSVPAVQLPVEPSEPVPVGAAVPTSSTVYVNGSEISFDAYNINDNNYFKLRDLAYALNDSEKRFEVTWDEAENAIRLTGGAEYTVVGGEMTAKGSVNKTPEPTMAKVLLDGSELSFAAYNIDGNNYFKLRDIGQAFDFDVSWDGVNNAISINTSEGYTAD